MIKSSFIVEMFSFFPVGVYLFAKQIRQRLLYDSTHTRGQNVLHPA